LGKLKYNNVWLEWKTFVSRNLARADQDEMEQQLIQQLQDSIETELKNETADTTTLKIIQDKIKAVIGAHIQ